MQSQSVFHFFISGLTLMVGAVNNLFIFSADLDFKGLFDFLLTAATVIALLGGTGIGAMPLKFFPIFETKDGKNNGLLSLCVVGGLSMSLAIILILHILLYFNDHIGSKFLMTLASYKWVVSFLIMLVVQNQIIVKYLHNYQKVSLTTFVTSFIFKLLTGLVFLLAIQKIISIEIALKSIPLILLFEWLIMMNYLYRLNRNGFTWIDRQFITPRFKSEIIPYAFAGIFMTISYTIIDKITLSMLGVIAGFKENGIFAINSYMATLILIPYISIVALYAPVISKAMANGDYVKVLEKYRKSSDFLLAFGILIFLLIWANIDLLPLISKNIAEVITYKYVIFFIALGYFVNMTCSVNDHIIAYSKSYQFNIWAGIILIGSDVLFNYLLIPIYGVYGAGIAAGLSLTIFNVVKSWFIFKKWKMNVLHANTLWIFALGAVTFLALNFMNIAHFWSMLLLKNLLILLLFLVPLIYFGRSEILEELKGKYLKPYFSKF